MSADKSTGRLAGRVALVTGASRGIGQALAQRLALDGAHVVLIARTVGGLEEADDAIRRAGGSATLIPQDLSDGAKLDVLGAVLLERFGRLDILVGAAAELGTLAPAAHSDPKVWDRVQSVNVSANMRLIRTLDPLLRASDAGRALFLTDQVGHQPTAYWNAYAASKAALEMLALTWAAELLRTNLKVNLADPGPTRTKLRAKAFPGEKPDLLPTPEDAAAWLLDFLLPSCPHHGQRMSRPT
jgi:NAD(P)-dependent dehydrogenase (short-subunit alcohol dehydrogenase family)